MWTSTCTADKQSSMRETTFLVYISKTRRDILFRQLVPTRHIKDDALRWDMLVITGIPSHIWMWPVTRYNGIWWSSDSCWWYSTRCVRVIRPTKRSRTGQHTATVVYLLFACDCDTIRESCSDIAQVMPSDGIASLALLVLPYMPLATEYVDQRQTGTSMSMCDRIRVGSAFHLNGVYASV